MTVHNVTGVLGISGYYVNRSCLIIEVATSIHVRWNVNAI